jgi:hypothetical protein
MEYYGPVTNVLASTLVRRERMLPVRGYVLVDMGDRVDTVDIIGKYRRTGRFVMLDAATHLHLRGKELSPYLVKRPGDTVQEGEAIASRPRVGKLFPRVLRAPSNGRVIAVTDSQVVVEIGREETEVRAHLRGRIVSVMPERGAVVETVGAVIQCARGLGKISHGVLRAAVEAPDEMLTGDAVDVSCLGAVVIGGAGVTAEALDQLTKIQARGLILGGLSSALLKEVQSLPFPVLITEGMGGHPLNEKAFAILTERVGKEACVNPGELDPWRQRRPEIIIPEGASETARSDANVLAALKPGLGVHVARGPHGGTTGTILRLPEHPVLYETGVVLPSVEVQFVGGERAFVPVNNVEILG